MKYEGFFSEDQKTSIDTVLYKKNKRSNCEECGLCHKCISPMMDYSGEGKKEILEIAEAPGKEEDRKGTQFVGEVGEMLRNITSEYGVDIDNDWYKDNAIACRPPKNRTPKKREILLCRPRVLKNIEKLRPKKIILFGKTAISSLMEDRIKIDSIEKWIGRAIPDQKFNAWLFPTYHPSYLYRDRTNIVLERILRENIKTAIEWDQKFPIEEPYDNILVLKSNEDIITYLSKIREQGLPISFDYETTGLKPHAEGHKIYCMAIASDGIGTITFPMVDNKKFHYLLKKILIDEKIGKVAQNCLKGKTRILMADGSTKTIKYLVDNKITDEVKCYNDKGEVVNRPIVSHFKNIGNSKYWYKIIFKTKKNKGHYPSIYCTEEHEIYTNRGKIKAKDLKISDRLFHIGGINKDLHSLIIGSMLGDGRFVKVGDCVYLAFYHCKEQINYLNNIRNYFLHCNFRCSSIIPQKGTNQYGFRVRANAYFRENFSKFTINYCIENMNLLSLAKWYMDDGSLQIYSRKKGDSYRVRISCKRFEDSLILKAISKIKEIVGKYDIRGTKWKTKMGTISFGKEASILFLKKISRYMNIGGRDLLYKNPFALNISNSYILSSKETYFSIPICSIKKIKINKKQSNYGARYDIEVADHHNYIANNIKVSNCKFEASWTRFILGYEVRGWLWDTMLASHVLDNREGTTGLKFQIYVNWGIVGYDDRIKPFLTSHSKDGNAFNNIKKAPINEVLLYCGVDAKYTHKLWKKQQKEISPFQMKGYQLFHNGTLEFERIQANGIRVDTKYYEKQNKHLERRIERIESKVYQSDEIKLWKKKIKKDFSIRSPLQIKKLLFDLLGYKAIKETAKGSEAIDGEVLGKIGTPFALNLMEYQRLYKLKNTYLSAFLREPTNGILRPFFDLHIPRSFRSSAHDPNFQNIPKRNKEAQRVTRKGIIPSPGGIILEADFKGIEVCISASYHKDPSMITYITDKSTDMHRDQAMILFSLDKEQVTSHIRYIAKNMWVFPQFYNSYYEQCAPNMWEVIQNQNLEDGTPLIDHLRRRGITNYRRFEDHAKKCERVFWYEKFKVYRKWKEKQWEEYQRNGYIKLHTGFICSGLMKRNAVVNYPVQGSAFHCLLWSLIRLSKISRLEKWKSKIIGQIHDSIVMDVNAEEIDHVVSKIRQVTEIDLRNNWKWINVPMSIEIEVSKINGNWYEKEEYKK